MHAQTITNNTISTHALCIFVENEFGVLQRITSLFSARRISIEAMHTATVNVKENVSQVTITVKETIEKIALMQKLLMRILIVHEVVHFAITENANLPANLQHEIFISKVFHCGSNNVQKIKDALKNHEIPAFFVPLNEENAASQIFVITGQLQKLLLLQKSLETIAGTLFVKQYKIL